MPRFSQLALLAVVAASTAVVSDAFTVVPRATSTLQTPSLSRQLPSLHLSDESKDNADSAVFIPPPVIGDDGDEEVDLDTVEGLGRGAAKVRRLRYYHSNHMHAPGYHPRACTLLYLL
jgi:hypothetical protein